TEVGLILGAPQRRVPSGTSARRNDGAGPLPFGPSGAAPSFASGRRRASSTCLLARRRRCSLPLTKSGAANAEHAWGRRPRRCFRRNKRSKAFGRGSTFFIFFRFSGLFSCCSESRRCRRGGGCSSKAFFTR